MSKRRTIGENPLDHVVTGNPLDIVVPGPQGLAAGRPMAEPVPEARLEELESAVKKLRMQVAEIRMELAEVKSQMFRDAYLLAQVKEKLAGK